MKRNQRRPELIGARKLTRRSLRVAINESQQVVKSAQGWAHVEADRWLYDQLHGKKWPTIERLARAVEHHVIVHQQRQVYALAKKLLGKPAAAKLAKAWTMRKA